MSDLNAALRTRALLYRQIREFFSQRKVLEVTTSVLSQAAVTEPSIESFQVASTPTRYLRTSPEFAMKRLLCDSSGDIYELGPVFRQGELGPHHNPEFTLLEWYRTNFSMQDLINEVVALLHCVHDKDLAVHQFTYAEAFARHAQLNSTKITTEELKTRAEHGGYAPLSNLDRDQWLDLIFSIEVQPCFEGIVVMTHYPASQAALAQLDPVDPAVALRFEVFIDGLELANGFQELSDAKQQLERFNNDNLIRVSRGQKPMPIDQNFIAGLETGLPECSGVALGVDRLMQLVSGQPHIADLLAWPWKQA